MNLRRCITIAFCFGVALMAWFLPIAIRAEPPGAPIIQLTNDKAITVRPAWSPDNRSIAFQSNRDSSTFHIYVMNADGSNRRALTDGATDDRHPAWMPDGKSILYDSSDGVVREIWIVNLADGKRKQLTKLGALANFVAPSPDGSRISFYIYQNETLDLWTARSDGSAAKPVTRNLASASNNQCTFACHAAAWSADGQLLAYSGGDHETVWIMRSDGTDAKVAIENGEHNHFPWFLPDGRLGYVHEQVGPAQSWTEAWAYNQKTGETTLLLDQMSPQGPFDWSNDGAKVLFHSPRSGNFEIYMVDLSIPGGLAALQGTPVPVVQAPSASGAPPSATAKAAPVDLSVGQWQVLGGIFGLVGLGCLVFVLLRRPMRR